MVLASILINVPKFFEFKYMYKNETLDYWTSDLNEDATYVVFSSYYECAVIGIIPLLALCYLNYKIYTGIKSSTKNSITKYSIYPKIGEVLRTLFYRHVGGSESSTSVYKLSDTRRCSEIPHHLSGLRANRPTRSQSRDFPGEQYEVEAMNPPLRNGDTFKDVTATINYLDFQTSANLLKIT